MTDHIQRLGTDSAACVRDDTISTKPVAAVLDLDAGACALVER